MVKTAMRRPLVPRISTAASSPPRTSPKAPRKMSSVWITAASSPALLRISRTRRRPRLSRVGAHEVRRDLAVSHTARS